VSILSPIKMSGLWWLLPSWTGFKYRCWSLVW